MIVTDDTATRVQWSRESVRWAARPRLTAPSASAVGWSAVRRVPSRAGRAGQAGPAARRAAIPSPS